MNVTSRVARALTRTIGCSLALLLATVSIEAPTEAWASASKLQLLGQSTLDVKASQGNDGKDAHVNILNVGPGPATVTTALQASSSPGVHAVIAPATLKAGQVGRIKVSFSGLRSITGVTDAQLVFTGGAIPVAKSVSITPAPQPVTDWPLWLVVGGFAAALVLGVGVLIRTRCDDLNRPAPGPKWKFDDSWATTLTAVGGVLGTVLGGVTFPATPRQVDKDTLVELSALFAAIVVVAPFILRALGRRVPPAPEDPGLWTINRNLALVSSLTFGAVIAELATLSLLGWELAEGAWWRWLALAAIASLGILASRYAWLTVSENAEADWSTRRQQVRTQVAFSGEMRLLADWPQEHVAEGRRAIPLRLHSYEHEPVPGPSLL